MTSPSGNTSWNPALMPNAEDLIAAKPSPEPESNATEEPASDLESPRHVAAEAEEHVHEEEREEEAVDQTESLEVDADESVEDNSDHPELPDLRNALESSLRSPGGVEMAESPSHSNAPEATVGEGKAEFPTSGPTKESKHLSTSSFARTVSHDVNWGEEDDVDSEWNLSRTDTDPFKMMPKTDRTNSFPPVPPASEHQHQYTRSIPHSQAEDIMNEVEQSPRDPFSEGAHDDEADFFTQQASGENEFAESHAPEVGRDEDSAGYGQSYGGEIEQEEEEDSRARFEEGIPLVQSNDEAQPPRDNLFSDDGPAEEEDFFAQTTSLPEQNLDADKPTIERKSTMQVMDSLHFEPHNQTPDSPIQEETEGHQDLPDSTLEEKEPPKNALEGMFDDSDSEFPLGASTNNADPGEVDLAEKWKAALAEDELLDDDDELLPDDEEDADKAVDPAAFFGSDDEGFLDDDEDSNPLPDPPSASIPTQNGQVASNQGRPSNSSNRYLPAGAAQVAAPSRQASNSYAPVAPLLTDFSKPANSANASGYVATPPMGSYPGQQPQQQRPDLPKAQSFADKSKGGYASPYDLPMEVVKPRKRVSTNQLNRGFNASAPPINTAPPRASSMNSSFAAPPRTSGTPPLTGQPVPQVQSGTNAPPVGSSAPKPKSSGGSGFFEDLPILSRPKAATRHSTTPISTQSMYSPSVDSGHQSYMPTPGVQTQTAPIHQVANVRQPSGLQPPMQSPPIVQGLVSPERISPYAAIPSVGQPVVPPVITSRYSPAPPPLNHAHSAPPPSAQGRYSPAPPQSRAQYAPQSALLQSPPQSILPHLPRTSSPLAHFEKSQDGRSTRSNGEVANYDRRSSTGYESNLRTNTLPPTREVDETESNYPPHTPIYTEQPKMFATPPQGMRPASQTPPPNSSIAARIGRSPPKRASSSHYSPQPQSTNLSPNQGFVPPPRSHTQSPGRAFGGPRLEMNSAEPYRRPASIEALSPRNADSFSSVPTFMAPGRPRAPSNVDYVAPSDGREHDPLQRWKGCPVFAWGVGGTMVTTFPKDIPRYGISSTTPMVVRSPGEVKIQNIKDLDPLENRLTSFPGPLKGKGKKKEVIAWLASGIEVLEQNASYLRNVSVLSHEDKRTEERLLLWKILQVFIDNDGILEGNPVVDKAVRSILSPGIEDEIGQEAPLYATGADLTGISQSASTMTKADPVDPAAVDQMRRHLLRGEREKAVWEAVDKRLWAHAMLISNTVSKELYKQVCQEFVQKEVKNVGDNTEPLAALYEIFAGNFEESIDELVPPSARAGFQMVSTSTSTMSPSKDALEGLDRWRETLGLVLSNRSVNDSQALTALGKLLSGYGRAEAAHICFLFARSSSVFGGIDDPQSNMVLVGSDHLRQPFDFDRELEPVLLSEVYEYGLSLSSTSNIAVSSPHLAVYKLHHAMVLAEYGHREKALQYCENLATSITSQTRRSPYHHAQLVSCLDDLSKRLKQSPKDENGSWISKPSIDKVSGSVWATFNKFVAGDDQDTNDAASVAGSANDVGPFARIAGGTPTISRSPSVADIYGSYNGGLGINGVAPTAQPNKTSSRYAPGASYASPSAYEPPNSSHGSQPRASFEGRSSSEYRRGPYEPQRQASQSSEYRPSSQQLQQTPIYTPQSASYSPYMGSDSPYTPHTAPSTRETQTFDSPQPVNSFDGPNQYQPSMGGYEPPSSNVYEPPSSNNYEPPTSNSYEPPTGNSYEPPSMGTGYEPPSYQPSSMEEPDSPIDTKPKKKSFMDDDEDDIPALKASSQPREKTKAEKDREADEAFRKAAEEDAKRDKKPAAPQKKGWGLGGWFGGGKKEAAPVDASQPNKPIRAKLGEESSFVYDPDLKRWINKKAGADNTPSPSATPPPPRAAGPPRTASGPPTLGAPTSMPRSLSAASAPVQRAASGSSDRGSLGGDGDAAGVGAAAGPGGLAAPPMMARSQSNGSMRSAPPSRPTTSMSNASSIDDLLGPPSAGGRKGTAGRKKKTGRGYIDVMGDKAAGGGS
ncbi:COPII coat assembly SEC16 protein [Rutstroemia sp. NJR-2017a WRK4]|nr:COPII coat assembly SEC16 protein [Rutstroemia sp. NJR-2017a WRK4]